MTGLPQSDSRHGNQDQRRAHKARVLTKPERQDGALSPRPAGPVLSSAPAQPDNGHPGGQPGRPAQTGLPSRALLCALLLLHRLQEEDDRIPPQQPSPSRWGMPARGSRTIKTKRKTKRKHCKTWPCLRQPRVQSQVLPAGCHSTGGKGKYKRSGGEGAHPARLCHALGGLDVINERFMQFSTGTCIKAGVHIINSQKMTFLKTTRAPHSQGKLLSSPFARKGGRAGVGWKPLSDLLFHDTAVRRDAHAALQSQPDDQTERHFWEQQQKF